MAEIILTTIGGNVLEIVLSVISIIISYYVIPAIKNDLIPYLREKRLYDAVYKAVQAVEKLYETGVVEKVDKKAKAIEILEDHGIYCNSVIEGYIESAVKQLDDLGRVWLQDLTDMGAEE